MITATEFRKSLRRVDPCRYPELDGYSVDEVYGHGHQMAPGGLYLATRMCRGVEIGPGDRVLDLGCGRGESSIYLAQQFGARVTAVDLWVSPNELATKFEERGVDDRVTPLSLDARRPLPFADEYFDVLFSMQAFFAFGATIRGLKRILRKLRPGGRLVFGSTCFSEEPGDPLPARFRDTDGWDPEYSKYHSPSWWEQNLWKSGMVDVLECQELEDGVVLWEDEFAYSGDRAGWTKDWFEGARWLAKQLAGGPTRSPYLTHLVATARKRPQLSEQN